MFVKSNKLHFNKACVFFHDRYGKIGKKIQFFVVHILNYLHRLNYGNQRQMKLNQFQFTYEKIVVYTVLPMDNGMVFCMYI